MKDKLFKFLNTKPSDEEMNIKFMHLMLMYVQLIASVVLAQYIRSFGRDYLYIKAERQWDMLHKMSDQLDDELMSQL